MGSVGTLDLRFQGVDQTATISEAGQCVAGSEDAILKEKTRMIPQGAAQDDAKAGDAQELGERVGWIEGLGRFKINDISSAIHPRSNRERPVEERECPVAFAVQAMPAKKKIRAGSNSQGRGIFAAA